jgi:protein-S-isoprenylcysteine O-methyltransferase Ste14
MPGDAGRQTTIEYSSVPISRRWDRTAALPLVLWSSLACLGFFIQIAGQWPAKDSIAAVRIASELSSAAFLAQQAILLCIRQLPILRAVSGIARFWAITGAYFGFLILLLPKAPATTSMAVLSSLLLLFGTAGSIASLISLGKSYAIFPQARALKTGGMYRIIRHPLYASEQIAFFGLALQFRQPWGLLIALAGLTAQIPRMWYEEKTLEKAFPEYRDYAGGKARLIPSVY